MRKVEPLQPAWLVKQAWITGMRASQAPPDGLERATSMPPTGWRSSNPLADWANAKSGPTSKNRVPLQRLHDKFCPIGWLCTNAPITPGEGCPRRSLVVGKSQNQECGLHVKRA